MAGLIFKTLSFNCDEYSVFPDNYGLQFCGDGGNYMDVP